MDYNFKMIARKINNEIKRIEGYNKEVIIDDLELEKIDFSDVGIELYYKNINNPYLDYKNFYIPYSALDYTTINQTEFMRYVNSIRHYIQQEEEFYFTESNFPYLVGIYLYDEYIELKFAHRDSEYKFMLSQLYYDNIMLV